MSAGVKRLKNSSSVIAAYEIAMAPVVPGSFFSGLYYACAREWQKNRETVKKL